jgi:hypothetical protein
VSVRLATVADSLVLAGMLHDFNTEFDTSARRSYERLGYSGVDQDTGKPAIY